MRSKVTRTIPQVNDSIFYFIWGEAVGDFLPPLAPDHNKKEYLYSLFLWSPVRERPRSGITRTKSKKIRTFTFFIFLIACTRKLAKQGYLRQTLKRKIFIFFLLRIACIRKTTQQSYSRHSYLHQIIKKGASSSLFTFVIRIPLQKIHNLAPSGCNFHR